MLQLDYMVSCYCCKDHADLYKVIRRVPPGLRSSCTFESYPKLFQRALVSFVADPQLPSTDKVLIDQARPLEDVFGALMYDKNLTDT
jgi:hypothetical protein